MIHQALARAHSETSLNPVPIARGAISRLGKDILPFKASDFSMRHGIRVLENPDPVLRFIAGRSEEAYTSMEDSELAVSNARQQRTAELMSYGSELIPGTSGSNGAKRLFEFGVDLLKGIPRFGQVQECCLDALYKGWRPMYLTWSPDLTHRGRSKWGINRIVEKKPEDYRFVLNASEEVMRSGIGDYTMDLAWLPDAGKQPVVFESDIEKLSWMICTSKTLDIPYGIALYRRSYMLWFIKNRFMQLWSQGSARSLGVLKAKRRGGSGKGERDPDAVFGQIKRELGQVTEMLSAHNILLELEGWEIELITDVAFQEGWMKALKYCDTLLTSSVTGQNLTTEVGDKGSRAAAEVHERVLVNFAKADAGQLESWVNSSILERAIRINFPDPDPTDFPKWRSKIRKERPTVEGVQLFYNMGANIDGRISENFGIPLAEMTDPPEGIPVLTIGSSDPEGSSEDPPGNNPEDSTQRPEDPEDPNDPSENNDGNPAQQGRVAAFDVAQALANSANQAALDQSVQDAARSSVLFGTRVRGLRDFHLSGGQFPLVDPPD